jgi:hypothetical protein
MNRIDLYAALSYIGGGGLAAAAVAFATILPQYQTKILAISAIGVGLAGLLTRLWKNPSPPTGTVSVVAPAATTLPEPLKESS